VTAPGSGRLAGGGGASPARFDDAEACVDAALARVGKRVVLGTPLGLGKAPHLVNAFYRRAAADPTLRLTIVTALTLSRPVASSELERRLMEPLVERLFGDYPELDYAVARRRGTLPPNVEVREFYYPPGSLIGNDTAQQEHISSNYTFVVRDLLAAGINVIAQMVGAEMVDGAERLSLSSNPDLTLDLLRALRDVERPVARLAQVNRNMPFFYGDAMLEPAAFDAVVDHPRYQLALPSTPNTPISTEDYLLALHASALVRDGGTLQLGIGALGDAVTHLLLLRHQDNATWRQVLARSGAVEAFGDEIAAVGGCEPFGRGLYGASEMLVDGFLALYGAGILKRRVYPDAGLQRLVDAGRVGEAVTPATLEALVDSGAVGERLERADVERLQRLGVLRPEVAWRAGSEDCGALRLPAGEDGEAEEILPADLGDPRVRAAVAARGLGKRLLGGRLIHAGFFLGPRSFYQALSELPRAKREEIEMTAISFVNELYGDDEALKRVQRRGARFLNSGLKATLLGAVASETLPDGRVVSGVGGQYNFVCMAHELEDGRSVLMVRAVREHRGEVESNFVWHQANATIPRHLRDLVVSEYGIADLRGKTDAECVAALLRIADSRFQDSLMAEAKRVGKLPRDHRIADRFRRNTPERLEAVLAPYRRRGLFPELPFGSDLSEEEVVLIRALKALQTAAVHQRRSLLDAGVLARTLVPPEAARPYLARMGLEAPGGLRERALARAVVAGLALVGAV